MKVRCDSKRNEFSGQLCRSIMENSNYREVVQLAEHWFWEPGVAGSSPVFPTIWPGGQMVKSPLKIWGGV